MHSLVINILQVSSTSDILSCEISQGMHKIGQTPVDIKIKWNKIAVQI